MSLAIDDSTSNSTCLLNTFHKTAMQAKLNFRLQERPDEDLDVAAAFAINPRAVQDALCDAICSTGLSENEFRLLRMTSIFHSVLRNTWIEYKPLPTVLDACRQGKYGHPTERIFHTIAGEEGIVALGLVAKHYTKLVNEIDTLSEEESTKLAELVKTAIKNTKRATISEYLAATPKSMF